MVGQLDLKPSSLSMSASKQLSGQSKTDSRRHSNV